MFYINTWKYLILSSIIYLYLMKFSLIFFILLISNIIKWKNNIKAEKANKNLLKKNEIMKLEFDNEFWWYRAELNIKDIYGYLIKDINSIINYSNLLLYYNFFNCIIFNYEDKHILNTNNKIINIKKYNLNKKLNWNKNLYINDLNIINKYDLIYSKRNIKNYLNKLYKINIYLTNLNIINYKNIIIINEFNNNYKNNWWAWFKLKN